MMVHRINILGWDKHNKNKKKNHRYFLFDSRFFEDSKISQLRQIEVILYVRCLCIAADLNANTFQIHKGMLPKGLRIDDKLLLNSLKSLQSFQLLTSEIETPLRNRIEENRKEKNIKGKPISDVPKVEHIVFENPINISRASRETAFPRLIVIWNQFATKLSKVEKTNAARNKKTDAIWKNLSEAEWIDVIKRINASDFCLGAANGSNGWRATYDWLLQKETYLKVLEGKYDNRHKASEAQKMVSLKSIQTIEEHARSFQNQKGDGLARASENPTLNAILERFKHIPTTNKDTENKGD